MNPPQALPTPTPLQPSSSSLLHLAQLLHDFSGQTKIESEDPKWSQLLNCTEILLLSGNEDIFLEMSVRLVVRNTQSMNVVSLCEKIVSKLKQVIHAKVRPNEVILNQSKVGLHLIRLIMHHFAACVSLTEIKKHCGLTSLATYCPVSSTKLASTRFSPTTSTSGEMAMLDLIHTAIDIIVATNRFSWIRDVTLPCLNFLISLLSPQLYSLPSSDHDMDKDLFLNYLYYISESSLGDLVNQRHHVTNLSMDISLDSVAVKLVAALLHHAMMTARVGQISSSLAPTASNSSTQENSISINNNENPSIWKLLFHYLQISFWSTQPKSERLTDINTILQFDKSITESSFFTVSERSLSLLLLLLHNRRSTETHNPFRQALQLFHDESLELIDGQTDEMVNFSNSQIRIDFKFTDLIFYFSKNLQSENVTLLLYSFLQQHPIFLSCLSATGDISYLIVALCRDMYLIHCDSSTSSPIEKKYLNAINILCFVQDTIIGSQLCNMNVKGKESPLEWYKERNIELLSCCDLIILSVVKALTHSLFTDKDSYLQSNLMAILIDISHHIKFINQYTAERIVSVLIKVGSKYIAVKQKVLGKVSVVVNYANAKQILNVTPHSPTGSAGSRASPVRENVRNDNSLITADTKRETEDISMDFETSHVDEQFANSLEELLLVFVLLINNALRNINQKKNINMLYAMVRKHDSLVPVLSSPLVQSAFSLFCINIHASTQSSLKKSCQKQLELYKYLLNPDLIVTLLGIAVNAIESSLRETATEIIVTATQGIKILTDILQKDEMLTLLENQNEQHQTISYAYQEGDNPEDFFVPYVWMATIRAFPDVFWDPERITLFDPGVTGIYHSPFAAACLEEKCTTDVNKKYSRNRGDSKDGSLV